ncbi:MAG: DUF4112 domain-containing protein [Pyrinomonadaceae bacterium]
MKEAGLIQNLQSIRPLSKRDERREVEIEESLEQLSYWLDDAIRIPGLGWRFGLDALIGFIPGLGDTATTIASFYILAAGVRYRVPKITILRMALNIAIDYIVGTVPFVGDLFDFAWKSNKMNMNLLRTRATVSAAEAKNAKASDWLFVGGIMVFLLLIFFGSLVISFLLLQTVWQTISQTIY